MKIETARSLLRISENATIDEIEQAYKVLLTKIYTDKKNPEEIKIKGRLYARDAFIKAITPFDIDIQEWMLEMQEALKSSLNFANAKDFLDLLDKFANFYDPSSEMQELWLQGCDKIMAFLENDKEVQAYTFVIKEIKRNIAELQASYIYERVK